MTVRRWHEERRQIANAIRKTWRKRWRDLKFRLLQAMLRRLAKGTYSSAQSLRVGPININISQPMWVCEVDGGWLLTYSRPVPWYMYMGSGL